MSGGPFFNLSTFKIYGTVVGGIVPKNMPEGSGESNLGTFIYNLENYKFLYSALKGKE